MATAKKASKSAPKSAASKEATAKTTAATPTKKATPRKSAAKKTAAKKAAAPVKKTASAKKAAAPVKKTASAKKAAAPAKKAAAKQVAKKEAAPAKKTAKAAATKTAARPAPARKKAAARKTGPIRNVLKKNEIIEQIAEATDLNKKQVTSVFAELESLIERSIRKRSVGEIKIPGLIKITRTKVKARGERMGRNLRSGQPILIEKKPAHNSVKLKAFKKLKDMTK